MNRAGRVAFIALCVIAFVLLIVTFLVLAGVGVKDKPASTTSAPGPVAVLSGSSRA